MACGKNGIKCGIIGLLPLGHELEKRNYYFVSTMQERLCVDSAIITTNQNALGLGNQVTPASQSYATGWYEVLRFAAVPHYGQHQ